MPTYTAPGAHGQRHRALDGQAGGWRAGELLGARVRSQPHPCPKEARGPIPRLDLAWVIAVS